MDAALDALVRFRAGGRCEYCGFPETFAELPFQLDHIVARQHGGKTEPANLAFVCCFCNRHKGPNLAGVDPVTEAIVCLYHPRKDSWVDHFAWDGPLLTGRTPVGRATIRTLAINRSDVVAVRQWLMATGCFFTEHK